MRLTAWYVSITTLFAVLFAAGIYLVVASALTQRTDSGLVESAHRFHRLLMQEHEPEESSAAQLDRLIATELPEIDLEDAQAVLKPDGRVVAEAADRSNRWMLPYLVEGTGSIDGNADAFRTAGHGETWARIHADPFTIGTQGYVLVLARSIEDQNELLRALRTGLWVGIPLWILGTAALGYWLLRRTLAPIGKMSREVASIGAKDLDRRLRLLDSRDEFGQLGTTFNALLDRLQSGIEQQRRFMADASHEMRTPVAVVRGEADVALATAESDPRRLQDVLGVIAREANTLSSVVEDLFLLARADAGQQVLSPTKFYLDELTESVVRSLRSLAAQKGITIRSEVARDSMIEADEPLVRRMLMNILQNAVKYSRAGGAVHVALEPTDSVYVVDVTDSGAGIAKEERERIFERFYRGTRSGGESGSGLGLSIARYVAELHAGSLSVERSGPDGSTFRLTLPRSFSR